MKKILFIISLVFVSAHTFAQKDKVIESMQKFGRVMNAIDNYYVDTANIDALSENAIINLLGNLDPHSAYISKEEFRAANEPLEGSFEGIGVEFTLLKDTLVVVSPVSGGPSERVGIQAGDKIVAVNGENIAGVKITNDKVFKLLRGSKGTIVNLDIVRKNVAEILKFDVTRDKIPINSLDASFEILPGVAYIRLGRFAATSMDEILTAVKKLSAQPEAIILDLRGNGGGFLGTAIKLADQFFDAGKIIVYTTGTHFPSHYEHSTSSGFFKNGKLVVLVDEGSASASEIVSGAIQDWDRGVLIGRRTYGKGLVQQQIPLGDGSYIRLTVSRYHTPTGRVIQRPYEKGNKEQYIRDYYKRFTDGETFNQDSIHFADSLKFETLVSHRTVYGGGGIMPDIFVPQDTSMYSDYYAKLIRQGILNRFVVEYMADNRKNFKNQYPEFEDFKTKFVVDDALIEKLVLYAEKEKLPRNDKNLQTSLPDLKITIKALFARDLWGINEYFKITTSLRDHEVEKALEVIKNWDTIGKNILKKE